MPLDTTDKEWLMTNMKLTSIQGSKAAVKEHLELTHGPLEKEVAEAKTIALAANKKSQTGVNLMWLFGVLGGLVITVGAAIKILGH